MQSILRQGFDAQAKSLREFGYRDVTAAMVEEAHGKWRRGEPASDIVGKFCESAFEDYPQIFGQPDAALTEKEQPPMAEIELKPCPFCGSDDVAINRDRVDGVWCRACHIELFSTGNEPDEVAWNRRARAALNTSEGDAPMAGWTIARSDGDAVEVVPAGADGRFFGVSDALLNGVFPTKLAALEGALADAVDELLIARSRVRKLRARLRRERARTNL